MLIQRRRGGGPIHPRNAPARTAGPIGFILSGKAAEAIDDRPADQ